MQFTVRYLTRRTIDRLLVHRRPVLVNCLLKHRHISTRIYDQLTFKGLLCSSFPDNVDINQLLSKKQTIYAGFDPTAPSLHVGNLLVLISLLHLLHHGHRVVVLIGDATAMIGDPSGKTVQRPIIDEGTVERNASGIEEDILRVVDNYKKYFAKHTILETNLVLTRNSTWYRTMTPIEFMHSYGRHLRMGDLLSKSSVRERLESPHGLSFGEFSYQLFQAYDWLQLFKQYKCRFQIGGVDQTVNIHNGHDLIKKYAADNQTWGLFVPLITDEKGAKIGKSDGGKAVYLNKEMSSYFNFFQYFMRLRDSDVSRLLKMFSFRPERELETMIQQQLEQPKPWRLQKKLAEEMTLLVHGEQGLAAANRITNAFFSKDLNLIGSLAPTEINEVFDGAEEYSLEFNPGQMTVLDVALRTNCFDSPLAAVNTIQEGGFYLNYLKIKTPGTVLSEDFILANNVTIVSVGKRNHRLVRWL